MSTIDYKALAERVAQRAIYADNNADPNNKAWAADLRAVVSLLNGMADAQPVAAVPVDWTERLKEAVKQIGYANVEKWYRLGGEDMIEQAKSDAVTAYATLCEALESLYAAPAAPQAEPKRDWSAIDAAIREYLDGYEQIGENDAGADACYTPTERERDLIYDAINGLFADESFVAAISAPQTEPKREPLTQAAHDVLAERRRQIDAEGWTPEHDDEHSDGSMAAAAACYAMHSAIDAGIDSGQIDRYTVLHSDRYVPRHWPWDREWWKPRDLRRNLVKAGALILAEIERLDRMGGNNE